MSVARLNFSHVKKGEYDFPIAQMDKLSSCQGMHNRLLDRDYNMLALLLDTKGPEIRTGMVEKNGAIIELSDGDTVLLTTDPSKKNDVSSSEIYVDYEEIANTVVPGGAILLDDGLIDLEVVRTSHDEFAEVECIVKSGGKLGSTKGVNLPNVTLKLPSMTDKVSDEEERSDE